MHLTTLPFPNIKGTPPLSTPTGRLSRMSKSMWLMSWFKGQDSAGGPGGESMGGRERSSAHETGSVEGGGGDGLGGLRNSASHRFSETGRAVGRKLQVGGVSAGAGCGVPALSNAALPVCSPIADVAGVVRQRTAASEARTAPALQTPGPP